MFEMKIDFPIKITSEVVGYETLIEFYEKMSTIYNSVIIIDFRNNYWFEANLCAIFGSPLRPKVCGSLKPEAEMCATNREDAMTWLLDLELSTSS